jgi:excisionase family DNA binding protein
MEGVLEQILEELREIRQLLSENQVGDNVINHNRYVNTTMKSKEAAEYLGITENRLRTLAKEGKIKHFRAGNKFLFRRNSLDLWLNEVQDGSIKSEFNPILKKGLRKVKE